MKKTTISFEAFKEFNEFTLADLHSLYDDLYDEFSLLSNASTSFVENEDDLLQFTAGAGFNSVYHCALDLLASYGTDRGRLVLLYNLGLITTDEFSFCFDSINASIAFLKRFLLSNAIWKEV